MFPTRKQQTERSSDWCPNGINIQIRKLTCNNCYQSHKVLTHGFVMHLISSDDRNSHKARPLSYPPGKLLILLEHLHLKIKFIERITSAPKANLDVKRHPYGANDVHNHFENWKSQSNDDKWGKSHSVSRVLAFLFGIPWRCRDPHSQSSRYHYDMKS